ncbi:MAG: helix-turn-helix transcriptional regulator [Butyrivibrio sp.]|nr:helix-turn-helix transcriptional regulator [Butyrivibrio sp.]
MKPILDTERLKEKREEKGWSRNQASQEMGLLQSAYSRYESGHSLPSNSVLKIMALTLGTSVEYLSGKTNDDKPLAFVVDAQDSRISYIVEAFQNSSEENKDRLYKYAKKINAK